MSSRYLLRTGLALAARLAPKLSATTPAGALCAMALVYVSVRR
ncbi:hypothetical protein N0B31_18100 [Salinirubellus salinus]|uniref:Uncharacterized protein n=1 Tax=Salinirubellus salinus TaxID=1364945 RepID=A0A9E7R1J0_9EURY|nr:hypothetical protein [Salinirubellus salinus]UWM54021.1 hypothetical protein N0B31_18100 [Salinirubellus salinus]